MVPMELGGRAEPFHQHGFDSGVGDGGIYVLRKVDRGGNVAGTVKSSSSLNNEHGGGVLDGIRSARVSAAC